MIRHVLAGAMLISSMGAANAASINYYGQYYTQASGTGPEYVSGFGSDEYVFSDGYNQGMRIELMFELAAPLASSSDFEFTASDFLNYTLSDGLYERTPEDPGFVDLYFYASLSTDSFGHISAWDILAYNGSAADFDMFGTRSDGGDTATHSREYETIDDDGQIYVSGVYSEASVETPGVWVYDSVPAPVPLPASLSLVLSGIGLLGLVRRRRRLV